MLEEVHRNMVIVETLWEVVPRLYHDLRSALRRNYGDHPFRIPRLLRFGTWIGGDRDGNPFVTAEVTRQTLAELRQEAMQRHLAACRRAGRTTQRVGPLSPDQPGAGRGHSQRPAALAGGGAVDRRPAIRTSRTGTGWP